MPVEVADTALDLVAEDVRTTGRPAHVQLAGGEPTLVPSLIEHVAKRVVEIRWEKVTCGIQTNAARLHGDIIAITSVRSRPWSTVSSASSEINLTISGV